MLTARTDRGPGRYRDRQVESELASGGGTYLKAVGGGAAICCDCPRVVNERTDDDSGRRDSGTSWCWFVRKRPQTAEISRDFFAPKLEPFLEP
jgi:hypothetical protein